jgi:energy-coupling factor transport system ATP-binding protein
MSEFVRHAPHLLSGGQKQRVAIAGVIAMEPACIVLDEATAMLDPIGRQEVLSTVHRLNREKGITVVLITHHMNEAADADRVIVMDDGLVAMDGAPGEIFSHVEELRAMGLTVPDTVALLYGLRQEGLDVPLSALSVEDCADAAARALGYGPAAPADKNAR